MIGRSSSQLNNKKSLIKMDPLTKLEISQLDYKIAKEKNEIENYKKEIISLLDKLHSKGLIEFWDGK